ncbi:MAG: hypothetical protein IJ514_07485, partial [Clostridia bacterium]|nr:hypothetical protein [Clostridia bacterium]
AKYQWHAESKPHGFEVQDYRMGGLRQRIVHLRERLTEYLDGKLARLEELEDEVLNVTCGIWEEGKGLDYRGLKNSVTAGVY